MAVNPMQRKARLSFLLGMILTLIITGIVIALLILKTNDLQKTIDDSNKSRVSVLVLNTDVKSGEVITQGMLEEKSVDSATVPGNAFNPKIKIKEFSYQDQSGNEIKTEISKNEVKHTISIDGKPVQLEYDSKDNKFYKEGTKEAVELKTVPLVAKIDMNANTVITPDLFTQSDEKTDDTTREEEYNMLVLPIGLVNGDYIDVRLSLPTGQDYIVLSKKKVTIPDIGEGPSTDTIDINLTEDEIITMNSAIVESAQILGSKLRVNKYTEAGNQTAATATYQPSANVMVLIRGNPNIVKESKEELVNRFKANLDTSGTNARNDIQSAISAAGDEGTENIKTQVTQSMTKSKEEREKYLEAVGSADASTTSSSTSSSSSSSNSTNTSNTTNTTKK